MGEQEAQPPTSPRKLLLLEIVLAQFSNAKVSRRKFLDRHGRSVITSYMLFTGE